MRIKAKIFGIDYDVLPQIKLIEKLSEELDMYEFTLSTLDELIDFDFKKHNGLIPITLMLEYNNKTKYFYTLLSNYRFIEVEQKPKKWQCVIQACSNNLSLQRYTLPNKLITQPISDTKKTVWQELNKIMEVYAPRIVLDSNLEQLMNIPCPEFQFVKATLYEVLIVLFGVCKLIPKMDAYLHLSYLSLEGSGINYDSENHLIRIERSNSINEYADMLDYDVENAISKEEDIDTGWIKATSDEAVVTQKNYYWKMPSDIYEIKKVELSVDGGFDTNKIYSDGTESDTTTNFTSVDVTDFVVHKSIYDTLRTSAKIYEDGANFKRNNLYYENNIITGGAYTESNWTSIDNVSALLNVIRLAFEKQGYNLQTFGYDIDERKYKIRATYQTELDNSRIKIVKKGIENPYNNLISNQEESYIDLINFGKQKQEVINRIGNEQILGNAVYTYDETDIDDIVKLGDTIDNDYIVVERQIQFNENTYIVNYKLSKDYVYQTGYSGLNQIKRFTSIDTQNTVIRNDNFLFNFKFSFEDDNDSNLTKHIIENYGKEKIKDFHLLKTYDENDVCLTENYLLANTKNKVINDFVLLQFDFETNYKIGDAIEVEDNTYLKKPIKYTNNNGEFRYLDFYFNGADNQKEIFSFNTVSKRPEVILDEELTEYTRLLINKDNREITSLTLQLRVLGNEDIIVYEDFIKHTSIINTELINLKVYALKVEDFNTTKYTDKTINVLGNEIINATITFNENNINIGNVITENGNWCIGVCDENNNLLLGVNVSKDTASDLDLYLNEI